MEDITIKLGKDEYQLARRAVEALETIARHQGEPPKSQQQKPLCPVCGKNDQVGLINLGERYNNRKAWKCQRCNKWLPGNGG